VWKECDEECDGEIAMEDGNLDGECDGNMIEAKWKKVEWRYGGRCDEDVIENDRENMIEKIYK
jgi:hypothetical protein